MALTLSVANGGSGQVTVVTSGGNAGATNSIYYGSWDGSIGGVTFALLGTIVGNDLDTLSTGAGYYWLYAQQTVGAVMSTSNLFYVHVTDSPYSIHYECALAVQARLQSLSLSGLVNDRIIVQKLPWNGPTEVNPRCIISTWTSETHNPREGTNLRDDVGYPVMVSFFDATNQDITVRQERNLIWRERSVRACIGSQIVAGIGDGSQVFNCLFVPGPIQLPEAFAKNVDHSSFLLRFMASQTRGL